MENQQWLKNVRHVELPFQKNGCCWVRLINLTNVCSVKPGWDLPGKDIW